jgi:hypothetical protein
MGSTGVDTIIDGDQLNAVGVPRGNAIESFGRLDRNGVLCTNRTERHRPTCIEHDQAVERPLGDRNDNLELAGSCRGSPIDTSHVVTGNILPDGRDLETITAGPGSPPTRILTEHSLTKGPAKAREKPVVGGRSVHDTDPAAG